MNETLRYGSWKKLFDGFSVNILSQNYAGAGGSTYRSYALEFILWCESDGIRSIAAVKANKLYEYLTCIRERPHRRREGILSESTVKAHLFAVRLLFDYAFASGIIAYTVPFPKFILPERKLSTELTLDEVRELFAACTDLRDTALLTLAYGCGLRRNELRWLDTGDVFTHTGMLYVREGKGRKSRAVPLSDRSVANLREYERRHRPLLLGKRTDGKTEPAYILNADGMRITGNSIYKRIVAITAATGNAGLIAKNVTPHLLRHSIATHLISRDAELSWVQAFLGHSDPDSTHIYIKNRKLKTTF
ncbi:MAG: tyrosine-type recombinase/integrase [Leadbetterella sp.]|nr:tyrosine-type recombinase/integrase [Leadbetterella sp.]